MLAFHFYLTLSPRGKCCNPFWLMKKSTLPFNFIISLKVLYEIENKSEKALNLNL